MTSLTRIAEVLREVAYALDEPREDGRYKNSPTGTSPYICDRLAHDDWGLDEWLDYPDDSARGFLRLLGMGCGYEVFGPKETRFGSPWDPKFSDEQQHQRIAWLLFAADLADEWAAEGLSPHDLEP